MVDLFHKFCWILNVAVLKGKIVIKHWTNKILQFVLALKKQTQKKIVVGHKKNSSYTGARNLRQCGIKFWFIKAIDHNPVPSCLKIYSNNWISHRGRAGKGNQSGRQEGDEHHLHLDFVFYQGWKCPRGGFLCRDFCDFHHILSSSSSASIQFINKCRLPWAPIEIIKIMYKKLSGIQSFIHHRVSSDQDW